MVNLNVFLFLQSFVPLGNSTNPSSGLLDTFQLIVQAVLVLAGAFAGGLVAWFIQRRSLLFQHHKDLIERIYAPLFDELILGRKKLLDSLERMDHSEWNRVQKEHLTHWIPEQLKKLLDEIYANVESTLITAASIAKMAVSSETDSYLRSCWRAQSQLISVQISPGSIETGPFYISRPYERLTSEQALFRAIALNEPPPRDPGLQQCLDQIRGNMDLPFTNIDGLVETVRLRLVADNRIKEFQSAFKNCSDKLDKALELLRKQLSP